MRGEPSRRVERINELLRDEVSDLIRRELRDPRLAGIISVTRVETAPDLSTAKVFISVMGSEEDRTASLSALRGAAGFFHRRLLPRMRLRRVPDLDFRNDLSLEHGDHVLNLLRQLSSEQQSVPQTGDDERREGSREGPRNE